MGSQLSSSRSQTVCIDGCLSLLLKIDCGVPQGSVLGPLLYILFTNDLPDIVHDEHDAPLSIRSPNMRCSPCVSLVNYVDNGTYSFACKDPLVLSNTLTSKHKSISNYMESNKLVINANKTHLIVMGKNKVDKIRAEVSLVAGTHTIHPSETEKLLGCHIHQSLKWREHIQINESSLIRQLTSRLNALRKLAVNPPFKTIMCLFPCSATSSLSGELRVRLEPDIMNEIPVQTGILNGRNRNVKNIFQNLTCLFKMHIYPI